MDEHEPSIRDAWWRGLPALGAVLILTGFLVLLTNGTLAKWSTSEGTFGEILNSDAVGMVIMNGAVYVPSLIFALTAIWGWPSLSQVAFRTAVGLMVYLTGSLVVLMIAVWNVAMFSPTFWRVVGGTILLIAMTMLTLGIPSITFVAALLGGKHIIQRRLVKSP